MDHKKESDTNQEQQSANNAHDESFDAYNDEIEDDGFDNAISNVSYKSTILFASYSSCRRLCYSYQALIMLSLT